VQPRHVIDHHAPRLSERDVIVCNQDRPVTLLAVPCGEITRRCTCNQVIYRPPAVGLRLGRQRPSAPDSASTVRASSMSSAARRASRFVATNDHGCSPQAQDPRPVAVREVGPVRAQGGGRRRGSTTMRWFSASDE
jgi:hypothetical protein